jgi:hypothetical protein
MTNEKIKEVVRECVKMLSEKDGEIIANTIGERTIAHRLAVYLEGRFGELSVDVEYNRAGVIPKRLMRYLECGLVMPDIVVHKRLCDDENLLVIEMKKQDNKDRRDRKKDAGKLEAFTHKRESPDDYGYQLGLFLDIPVEKGEQVEYTWYKDGKLWGEIEKEPFPLP